MKIKGKTVILNMGSKEEAEDITAKISVLKNSLAADTPEEALLIFINLTLESINKLSTVTEILPRQPEPKIILTD